MLRSLEVLFIIEDIIANESLDKRRQPLLELSISGRHRCHYLWLLTQSHTAIPKYSRRQSKGIFVWHPKERRDLKMIHDENDALTDDELVVARNFLKKPKHACLLWQSRQLLNTDVPSSADLTCFAMEKTLLLPHLKQVYNVFSRVFHGFSSCLITRFTFSVAVFLLIQKKVAEILPIQAMKLPALLPVHAMKLPALLTIQAVKLPALPTPPQDQMILMFMALV